MSAIACIFPLIAGLSLFSSSAWSPAEDIMKNAQKYFLETLYPHAASLDRFREEELSSCVSDDVETVNEYLRTHEFSIQLSQGMKDSVYLACKFKVDFAWGFEEAKKTTLKRENEETEYPAVSINDSDFFQAFTVNDDHHEDIFKIPGKQPGEFLYITQAPTGFKPNDSYADLHIMNAVTKISQQLKNPDQHKKITCIQSVMFPMVDLDDETTLPWMLNMRSEQWFIAEAKQQTKFQLNEKGASVFSGFAATKTYRCKKEDAVIDKPFLVWIERDGVELPIFAAYCDESCWKEPVN